MDLNISNSHAFNKYLFNARKQEANESIDEFANALSRLASNIGLGEQQVIDRFIAGLANDNARMGVLQAENEPYSLEVAVSLAKSNDHETIMYTTETSGSFDGYQVIVMQNQEQEEPPQVVDLAPSNFDKKIDYNKHLECSQCHFKCSTQILMSSHQWTMHNYIDESTRLQTCLECDAKFMTIASLEAHLALVHQHSKEALTKKRLSKLSEASNDLHIDFYEEPTDPKASLACELCTFEASTPMELTKHMQEYHSESNLHLCPECLFKAPNKALLKRHIHKVHDPNKKFRCLLCNMTFNTKGGLTRHTLKEHKGHKIFMCETCGKKFQTDKTLDVHKKVVHEQVKPFACDQCDYRAGQKASLIAHTNSVHENNRPYVCELCGYKTASPSTLNAHKRMVHEKQRPYVCETCGRSFAAKAGMENHILLIHEKAMPYGCENCTKRYKRKTDLLNHVRCFHQGNYFICQQCNSTFHSQRNLDRHVSVVHNQNKPYQCLACGLTFARKERLKQHYERAHDGEMVELKAEEEKVEEIVQTIELPVPIVEHHELQIHIQQEPVNS